MKIKRTIFPAVLVVLACVSTVLAGSQQTSITQAATIITHSRYYLNESTAKVWTDAEMLQWVNHGTLDIVARSQALQYTESVTLVSGQSDYTVTGPYIWIYAAIYDGKKGLLRGNPQSIGNQFSSTGEPNAFFLWDDMIWVYPAPNATAAGKTITLFGVQRPVALTLSSQTVLVPAHYDRALVYYVTAQAFIKTGQFSRSQYFTTLYLNEIDRFRVDYNTIGKEPLEISR